MSGCERTGGYAYPPAYRLRRREDIRLVQRRGARVSSPSMTLCLRANEVGHARFGFAVSRKVGNAVVRNRVKRRLREIFRHLRPELGAVDVLVLARPALAELGFDAMRAEVTPILTGWKPGDRGRKRRDRRRRTR